MEVAADRLVRRGGEFLYATANRLLRALVKFRIQAVRRYRKAAMINKCRMSSQTPSRFLHASLSIKAGRRRAGGCRLP